MINIKLFFLQIILFTNISNSVLKELFISIQKNVILQLFITLVRLFLVLISVDKKRRN